MAKRHKKPFLVVQLDRETPNVVEEVLDWLRAKEIGVLNTSGPGGLKVPGIH
jgi:hypothetical protein